MGYVLGQCPQCNNVMSMPDDSAVVRCPTCQSEVSAAEAAALAGTSSQMQSAQQPYQQAQQQAGFAPNSPYGQAQHMQYPAPPTANNEFLANWKTNVGTTIAGIVVLGICGGLLQSQEEPNALFSILSIAYLVYCIVHAAKIYPSSFTDKPVIANNDALSFLNAFAGGIIWGLLWNHNLTRGEKGISHIVYIVLIALSFVLAFVMAFVIAGSTMAALA